MDTTNKFVHLTNDAVQKTSAEYGRHEQGNKLSFAEYQTYLDDKLKQNKTENNSP